MTTNAKRNYHGNTTSADVMSLVNTKRRRTLSLMSYAPEDGAGAGGATTYYLS